MRDTTLVNKLVFPNIKRLATQPSISVQRSLLIPLCLLPPSQRRIPLYTSGLESKRGQESFFTLRSQLPALSLPKGAPRLQHSSTPRVIQHIGMVSSIRRKGP